MLCIWKKKHEPMMLVKDISESIFLTRICKLRLRHHHNAREITHIQRVLLPLFQIQVEKQHQMTFYFFTNALVGEELI
jgi:hypothetical protein